MSEPSGIESTEVSPVDVADMLAVGYGEVVEEGKRADTKAGHLLAMFGVLLAGVVGVASKVSLPMVTEATLWVSAVPLAAALVRLLLAVRPDWRGAPFARHAALSPAHIVSEFRTRCGPVEYRAERLHGQATATLRKYRAIRAAVGLVLLGGVGLVLAALSASVL